MLEMIAGPDASGTRMPALESRLLIRDDHGHVLLTRGLGNDADNEWMLPGGPVRNDEAMALAAVRWAHELLGVLVWPSCIISVWDSALEKAPRDDRITTTFAATILSGDAVAGVRSGAVCWRSLINLPRSLTLPAADAIGGRGAISMPSF